MTPAPPSRRRGTLSAVLAVLLVLSCAPDAPVDGNGRDSSPASKPEPTAETAVPAGTDIAQPPDRTEGGDPATAPPGFATAASGSAPIVAPDAELAQSALPGKAEAYWARSGQNVDAKTPWRSIGGDGIHDRTSGIVGVLQEPRRAFRGFPRANSGNYVDWAAALREGIIKPRTQIGRGGKMEHLDRDVLMVDTKQMPIVIFPHKTHTEWLACRNCHDWLFKTEVGANDISMASIVKGRQCGVCHGRVAFPPSECFRCHSGPRPK